MEVHSIKFPPVGPSFRDRYVPGSKRLNPQNLYKSNIYKNVGTHGIEKISMYHHDKQRSINGYTMERGKAAYNFKMPKGFSVRQLQQIQRTPRSGSVMRVIQQLNEEGDPPTYNTVPTPPNEDFAARRAPVDNNMMMDVDEAPQEGNVADAGADNPDIVNMVLQNRIQQVDLILQQQDEEINRRLDTLRRDDPNDGGQYRNAEGQWVIEGGLAQDAQTIADPFMLDPEVQLPVGPVQVDEIVQAQSRMKRSPRNIYPSPPNSPQKRQARLGDRKSDQKKQREDQFRSQRLSSEKLTGKRRRLSVGEKDDLKVMRQGDVAAIPQPPGPARTVIGKRRRRGSSVGGNVIKYRRGDDDFINTPPMVVNNVQAAVGIATPTVVKRKRQLSVSDQQHKGRKPRTDNGPRYTADRQVVANAPQRVRRNSNELKPAQGTRSKVKRK